MPSRTDQIRTLNDELRRSLTRGLAFITPGVAALGDEAVDRIIKTIAVYDDFCQANDPYAEHDFGAFETEGIMIFFKIDYYDRSLSHHSPGRRRKRYAARDHHHAQRRVLMDKCHD